MSQTQHGRNGVAGEDQPEGRRWDPVRGTVAVLLLIYLSPALLLIFVIGGLGVGLCAAARLLGHLGGSTRRATPAHHLAVAGREARSSIH